MKFDETINARFAEIEMPTFITTCETAAVNAFLKSEWVLIHDRRVTPALIVALPDNAPAFFLNRATGD